MCLYYIHRGDVGACGRMDKVRVPKEDQQCNDAPEERLAFKDEGGSPEKTEKVLGAER